MAKSFRAHRSTTLVLLFLGGVVNFFDRVSLSVANTSVRAELHLSATQIGWLLSAFSLAYGFAQLPLVGLLDRMGTRRVLGAGLTVWSVAQMGTAFVWGLPSFLALRVVLGVGEAPFFPAGMRSIREWFAVETRGRATAMMNSSQAIALAVAPPVLTWWMLRVGWRWMFATLGAVGLVVAIAWVMLHRERAETEFAETEVAALNDEGNASVWRVLLRERVVWGMMLGWGGINYTSWLYLAWLPGYLQGARHLSLARSGWVAALPFVAAGVGMYVSGVWSDARVRGGAEVRRVHRQNLLLGMMVSAASTLLVGRAGTTVEAVAGISVALFAIHFAGTSGWGYVQTVVRVEHVASLGALQNFAGFMIASAAPVLTGAIVDRTHSFTLAFVVCSMVTLGGALSYAVLARPARLQSV
jgi:sugar phosphate permease